MDFEEISLTPAQERKLLDIYLENYKNGELLECNLMCDFPKEKHMLWQDFISTSHVIADDKAIREIKERLWEKYLNK